VTVDDAGDDVGEVTEPTTLSSLQASTSEAMTAQCSAPPSEPAKNHCEVVVLVQ
jgi:hypothetical protein